jgi:hypothetical protein
MKQVLLLILVFLYFGQQVYSQSEGVYSNLPNNVVKCLEIARQKEAEGDRKEASRYLNQAATIEWEARNFARAVEYFEESLRLNEQISNLIGIIAIHNNLGLIHSDQASYEKALYHFKKNIEGKRKIEDKFGLISSLINASVCTNNLKRYSESATYLQEALDIARERNDAPQMRSCYGMLAETYEKAGDLEKTLYYFNLYRSFHELVQKERVKGLQKTIEQTRLEARLLEMEKRNKELELAGKTQELQSKNQEIKEAGEKNRELLNNLSKQELVNFLLKKEADLKSRNADIQKLENEKQQANVRAKLKESQYIRNYLIIILLALVCLGGFLLLRYRERIRINKVLAGQKQELEVTNQLKDKLFSVIAHDLRSPLGSLQSLLELLEEQELSESETYLMVKDLKKKTRLTLDMLENLLQWSIAQIKGLDNKPQKIAIHRVINKKFTLLDELASKKQIILLNEIPESIQIIADSYQLCELKVNLV